MMLMKDDVAVQTEVMEGNLVSELPHTRATLRQVQSGTVRPIAEELGTLCSGSLRCRYGHVHTETPTCSVGEWVGNDIGRRAYCSTEQRSRCRSSAMTNPVPRHRRALPRKGGERRNEGKLLLPKVR